MRDDAIMATGRSDYPNQVNNVLGFPFIFRGALDVPRDHDQHGDEDRRRRGAGLAGARGRAGRGRRRLSGRAPALRQGLHHPGPVRSAPDPCRADRGRQGRDGDRRRRQADRRHARLQGAALGKARSGRRHAEPHLRAGAALSQARRLRRGRGGAGHPRGGVLRQPGARARRPRRPRGARLRDRDLPRHRSRGQGHLGPECAALAPQHAPMRNISTSGCSAMATSSATASA